MKYINPKTCSFLCLCIIHPSNEKILRGLWQSHIMYLYHVFCAQFCTSTYYVHNCSVSKSSILRNTESISLEIKRKMSDILFLNHNLHFSPDVTFSLHLFGDAVSMVTLSLLQQHEHPHSYGNNFRSLILTSISGFDDMILKYIHTKWMKFHR